MISAYTLDHAIADGVLVSPVELLNDWLAAAAGKPIILTAAIFRTLTLPQLDRVWQEFVAWRRDVMPTLPEEEWLFTTEVNDRTVWVDETPEALTVMYPEDY